MAKKEPRSETVKMLKKELKIDVAKITDEEKTAGKTVVADVKFEPIVKIAKERMEKMTVKDLKAAVKTVLGTLNSMNGIMVEGKRPREIAKEIDEGKRTI